MGWAIIHAIIVLNTFNKYYISDWIKSTILPNWPNLQKAINKRIEPNRSSDHSKNHCPNGFINSWRFSTQSAESAESSSMMNRKFIAYTLAAYHSLHMHTPWSTTGVVLEDHGTPSPLAAGATPFPRSHDSPRHGSGRSRNPGTTGSGCPWSPCLEPRPGMMVSALVTNNNRGM